MPSPTDHTALQPLAAAATSTRHRGPRRLALVGLALVCLTGATTTAASPPPMAASGRPFGLVRITDDHYSRDYSDAALRGFLEGQGFAPRTLTLAGRYGGRAYARSFVGAALRPLHHFVRGLVSAGGADPLRVAIVGGLSRDCVFKTVVALTSAALVRGVPVHVTMGARWLTDLDFVPDLRRFLASLPAKTRLDRLVDQLANPATADPVAGALAAAEAPNAVLISLHPEAEDRLRPTGGAFPNAFTASLAQPLAVARSGLRGSEAAARAAIDRRALRAARDGDLMEFWPRFWLYRSMLSHGASPGSPPDGAALTKALKQSAQVLAERRDALGRVFETQSIIGITRIIQATPSLHRTTEEVAASIATLARLRWALHPTYGPLPHEAIAATADDLAARSPAFPSRNDLLDTLRRTMEP
ncbi:MAG: hypothetical protein IPL40_14710 [Proteobacteria bacterium]|nr:hypothetical protein [Pseudomonadota bacterium]